MGKRIDLTGQRFGRLVVVSYNKEVSKQKKTTYWNCKCDCGNEKIICGGHLKRGYIISCGCYRKEKAKEMWKDEEYRQMHSNKAKEQWKNEEFRQKQSDRAREQMKQMWEDEEFKQMKINKIKEQWKDEEFRKMQSNKAREQMKEMWKDENFRQMKSNEMKEKWRDEEYRKMKSDMTREQMKQMWKDEEMKWKMNYKGGITPISIYLRILNEQWNDDCKRQANYTCELTGKVGGKLHTHHLKAFSTIVLEAHELNNIEIHEVIGEYTQEELHKLKHYVISWHKDNSNAVVLCEEAHRLFHSLYGRGGNTPEQYIEFRERYLNGEFKEIIK